MAFLKRMMIAIIIATLGSAACVPSAIAGYLSDPKAITLELVPGVIESLKDLDNNQWGYMDPARGDTIYTGEQATYGGFHVLDHVASPDAAEICMRGVLDDHGGVPVPYDIEVTLNGILVSTSNPWIHGSPWGSQYTTVSNWAIPVAPSLLKAKNDVRVALRSGNAINTSWIMIDWISIIAPGGCANKLTSIVDIEPDELGASPVNRASFDLIPAYIELPVNYSPSDIDTATVKLQGPLGVASSVPSTVVGDHDSDGVPDLEVMFNYSDVRKLVNMKIIYNAIKIGERCFTIRGALTNGQYFDGQDCVYLK